MSLLQVLDCWGSLCAGPGPSASTLSHQLLPDQPINEAGTDQEAQSEHVDKR